MNICAQLWEENFNFSEIECLECIYVFIVPLDETVKSGHLFIKREIESQYFCYYLIFK